MLPGLTFSLPAVLLLLPLVLGWAAWLWLRDRGNLSPQRHRLALALRLVILGVLVLVLAGATWQQPQTRQATIFVADLSASVAGLRDREVAFIARALKARGREDAAAVVADGGDALVEQPVSGLNDFSGFSFATHVVLYPTTVMAMLIGAVLSVVSWIPRPQLAPVADQAADSIKIAVLFALCVVTIAAGSYSPFLYFRF